MTEQPGDDPRPVFPFLGSHADHPRQVSCWITHTSERTHDIIRGALDRSALYSLQIEGTGPPSYPANEAHVTRERHTLRSGQSVAVRVDFVVRRQIKQTKQTQY